MDHSQRLAAERQSAPSFGRAKLSKRLALLDWSTGVPSDRFHIKSALRMAALLSAWPEHHQRKIRWLSAKEAAKAVREPVLGTIIRRLARASSD